MGWVVKAKPRPPYTRERNPVLIMQVAGWALGPVWTGAENLASTGIRSPAVQSVAILYTDWATPVHPNLNVLKPLLLYLELDTQLFYEPS